MPKETLLKTGPRFSVIAWGRRRTITRRNGGTDELGTRDFVEDNDECERGSPSDSSAPSGGRKSGYGHNGHAQDAASSSGELPC